MEISAPEMPSSLVEYQDAMVTYGTAEMTEDESNARVARESTRAVPRTATDTAGTQLDVSDRFCALDYSATCNATWNNGNAKPAGLECAGVKPDLGAECDTEFWAKYAGIPMIDDTVGALSVVLFLPIILGIVFMVLYLLWYILRCLKCCGGRKASKGCCRVVYVNEGDDFTNVGKAVNSYNQDAGGDPPSYTQPGGCCSQVNMFRAWFCIFFLLVTASLGIGLYGNLDVDTGLANTIDIVFYDVKKLTYDTSNLLDSLNSLMDEAGLAVEDMAEQENQLNCLAVKLEGTENDIDEYSDYLDYRNYFVYVTLAIPFLLGLIYVCGALRASSCCACFGSSLAWLLLLVVCLSAAIHSYINLLLADVCYEFDLHLASYYLSDSDLYGTSENLAWLPEEAQGICGEDGKLAFIEGEFLYQMDEATTEGIDKIAEVCNDADMQAFMDCTGVSVLVYVEGTGYVAQDVDYTQDRGAFYWAEHLAEAPDELMILDGDADSIPDPVTLATSTEPDDVALYSCLDDNSSDQPEQIIDCKVSTGQWTYMSFRDCAENCASASAQEKAAEAVDGVTDATSLVEEINVLYEDDAKSMLECKFVSEIVSNVFIPLCQEAYTGIFLIMVSNYLSMISLIITLPLGVMATKRFQYYIPDPNAEGARHSI